MIIRILTARKRKRNPIPWLWQWIAPCLHSFRFQAFEACASTPYRPYRRWSRCGYEPRCVWGEVENGPHLKAWLTYAEGTFYDPKAMVLLESFLGIQFGICDITFQSVPTGVLFDFVVVDGDRDVLACIQELFVSALVHLVFGQRPLGIGLLESCNASLSVMGILYGPGFGGLTILGEPVLALLVRRIRSGLEVKYIHPCR